MSSLIPINDRIVVEMVQDEERTSSGLYIPDSVSAKSPVARAKVLATGDGIILSTGVRVTPAVNVGDIIIYQRGAGMNMSVDGVSYLILTEREIIGILRD